MRGEFDPVGLPWTIDRLGGRIQNRLTAHAPATTPRASPPSFSPSPTPAGCACSTRGVWDAIATARPSVSYAVDAADIGTFVDVAGEFLRDPTR